MPLLRNAKRKKLHEVSESEVDESYSDDSEAEYFELDKNPLVQFLTKQLKLKYPRLVEKDLCYTLEKIISKADENLISKYCHVAPSDKSWKLELDRKEIKKLSPILQNIRKDIVNDAPTIAKILESQMSNIEKQRAVQLFDILKNTEPFTLEFDQINTQIICMLNVPKENKNFAVLKLQMDQQVPTSEKIISAFLSNTDKIHALQLYEIWKRTEKNTADFFALQKEINNVLDNQMKSEQEVLYYETQTNNIQGLQSSNFKKQIIELDADENIKSKIYQIYNKMNTFSVDDSKYAEFKEKLMWLLKLPYNKTVPTTLTDRSNTKIREYCTNIYQLLDKEIYGMKQVKEKIVQCMNDRIYNPNSRSIITLKGNPGVGKTKLAKTIAKAAGLPFEKIGLGGTIDSTIFKGSNAVWKSAGPSMILQILSRVKCSNTVILLDEIDKLSTTIQAVEVQNSLLHILDATQNTQFQDFFLDDFNHDISRVWFITTMNDDSKLDRALLDRLDIIDIPDYSRCDIIQIVQKFTLPEIMKDKGVNENDLTITIDAIDLLMIKLDPQMKSTGLRPIENAISNIVSKLNFLRSIYPIQGTEPTGMDLSFKLSNFHGFPYQITKQTIEHLVVCKQEHFSNMYI